MTAARAFFTYVHADNRADDDRLCDIARDIKDEYEAISGEPFELLLDSDTLRIGDEWRPTLTNAVASSTFLICAVTPRFFDSTECRRELDHFVSTADSLGRTSLVMPLLYIDVDDLDEHSSDSARARIARVQYVDWTTLRFSERSSSEYRIAVHEFATELRRRLTSLPDPQNDPQDSLNTSIALRTPTDNAHLDDDTPGPLDVLLENDGVLDRLAVTITELAEKTQSLGARFVHYNEKISAIPNSSSKGAAARKIHLISEFGRDLEPLAAEFEQSQVDFVRVAQETDPFVNAVLTLGIDNTSDEDAIDLANTVIGLVDGFDESAEASQGMIASLEGIASMTKKMRAPLRKIQRCLQSYYDWQPQLAEWRRVAMDILEDRNAV